MSDTLFQNTPEDWLASRHLEPQLLWDFFELSNVSTDQCRLIVELLKSMEVPTDIGDVFSAVTANLGDDSESTALAMLRLATHVAPDHVESVLSTFELWVNADKSRQDAIDAERRERIRENLPIVASPIPVIGFNSKAQDLVASIGNHLEEVRCYCDLRPVFDDSRMHIDGFVLVSTMRIKYKMQNGSEQVLELSLDPEELEVIRDEIDRTLGKVAVLTPLAQQKLAAQEDHSQEVK